MQSSSVQQQCRIVIFNKSHAPAIAGFQIKMAKQTQNLDLIPDAVNQAVQYLSDHSQLGFYLVKLNNQLPIGSLLLTFQNQTTWWIQSVYIQKQYRRQGHFKSLFRQASKIAKQKCSKQLKLYAQSHNQKAKQTYISLGMNITGQQFYTYDFVYGKAKLQKLQQMVEINQSDQIKIIFLQKEIEQFQSGLIMNDILGVNVGNNQLLSKSQNKRLIITRNNKAIGVLTYFTEFSEWRFGLTYYIDSFVVAQQFSLHELSNIHQKICQYFGQISQIKVGALRYIFRNQDASILKHLKQGEIQHYDVLQITL